MDSEAEVPCCYCTASLVQWLRCPSRAEDPRFKSRLRTDFSRSSHTSDLNICAPVATMPGAWHYRVTAETG